MDYMYQKLLIVDGSHTLHRSICEPHLWEMRNTDGARTGGVYGTLQSLTKECSNYKYYPVVVFDGKLSQRRLNIYPNYKKHADKQILTENINQLDEIDALHQEQRYEYNNQREILKQLLPAFGIPVIHLNDWEGDDLIYILSKLTKDSIVLSDDKDMFQLVYDDGNRKCSIKRGMRNEFIDINWYKDKNMTVNDFIARKALVGDPSDNIPSSCFQVGEKTALNLYKLYLESKNRNIPFPQNEKELTQLCTQINLPKRKAYLNFDENQFLKNILLMDLSLVDKEITNDLLTEINNIIKSTIDKIDVEIIEDILEILEIKTFLPNNLLNNLKISIKSIFNATPENKIKSHKEYKLF